MGKMKKKPFFTLLKKKETNFAFLKRKKRQHEKGETFWAFANCKLDKMKKILYR